MEQALLLLEDPVLDDLVAEESPFGELPAVIVRLAQDPIGCSGNIQVQDGVNILEL